MHLGAHRFAGCRDERELAGWATESPRRRALFGPMLVVLATLSAITVLGTIEGGGLTSPWLWSGLLLLPVLLGMVYVLGFGK